MMTDAIQIENRRNNRRRHSLRWGSHHDDSRDISAAFVEHRTKLIAGKGDYAGANPEDPDEYKAENVFWVATDARWFSSRNCGTWSLDILPIP